MARDRCPRCVGNMLFEWDEVIDSVDIVCLQCGYRRGRTARPPFSSFAHQRRLPVLKQHCAAGGAQEGAILEIQGDHRERVQAKLELLGHRVKMAGG